MKDRDCLRVQGIVDEMSADDVPLFVAKHISGCPDCRQYADKLDGLRKLLRNSHRVTVPDDFDARLRLRLQNRSAQRRTFWAFVPTPALAAAAIFLVASSITYTLVRHPAPNTVQQPNQVASAPIDTKAPTATDNTGLVPAIPTQDLQVIGAPQPKRYVPPTRTAANVERSAIAADPGPSDMILLRDQRGREQVIGVPRYTFGAKPVVPRSASNRHIQYEPSVF